MSFVVDENRRGPGDLQRLRFVCVAFNCMMELPGFQTLIEQCRIDIDGMGHSGELVFEKKMLGRYPDPEDVLPLLRDRLSS